MKKRGVSLIVLIITIIVIIILSGVIILNISEKNPITNAKEAEFKQRVRDYETELSVYLANKKISNPSGILDLEAEDYDGKKMQEVIKSMKNEDLKKFQIIDGKLVFFGENADENEWAGEIGSLDTALDFYLTSSKVDQIRVKIDPKYTVKYINYQYILSLDGNELQNSGSVDDSIYYFNNLETGKIYTITVNATRELVDGTTRVETLTKTTKTLNSLQLGRPIMSVEPNGWTNNNVTVTVSFIKEEGMGDEIYNQYVLQLSYTGDEDDIDDWEDLGSLDESHEVVVEENQMIFARIFNKTTYDGKKSMTSLDITNIDKTAPSAPKSVSLTFGTNSVTATASGSTDEQSGLLKYQYSLDNIIWQDSQTFTGIKSSTDLTIYARAVDKVENVSESVSSSGTTTGLGKVVLIPSTDEWTAGNVTVTVSHATVNGYVLQYTTDGITWKEFENKANSGVVIVDTNETTVAARMYNSSLPDEGNSANSVYIDNIDKVAPTTPTEVKITPTTNGVTAVAVGSTDNESGFSKYQYSSNGTTWQASGVFTGIKSGTNVTIYARAVDRVGNISLITSNKGTTLGLGKVSIEPSTDKWTAGDVTVTISHAAVANYVLQYTTDGSTWKTFANNANSGTITISTNNTTVISRMYNAALDDEGNSANSKTIDNIDKEPPTTPTSVQLSMAVNGLKATASGSTDTLSGFSKYQYSLDNGTWQDSGVFTGIKSSTNVTIYARAVDVVGNISEVISNKGTTIGLGQVTMTTSTDDWTKGDVTVTISHVAVDGYVLQYTTDGSTWKTFANNANSGTVTVSANNTTVIARMYNSTLADEGNSSNSIYVDNIDKVAPTVPTKIEFTVTTNGIKATASGSTDTLSGFSKYQYSSDGTTWQDSSKFTGIKSGTNVTIYARAVDKVGNVSESKSSNSSTATLGKVTMSSSTNAWTAGDVTVTMSHAAIDGYILQYTTDGSTWKTFANNANSGTVTVSANNTIVTARMYNSTLEDEGDSSNSVYVDNIDKVSPTTPTSVTISTSTNSVTAAATGSTDTGSGFSKYQYSSDGTTWQDNNEFTGIKSGTNVTIYARAVDKVGNVSKTKSSAGTTTGLGKVTLTTSTDEWTKGDVTVTISHAAVSNYVLQYTTDGSTWKTFTNNANSGTVTVSTNNTTVVARMYNSTLADEGNSSNSVYVDNIDKVAPSKPTSVTISTATNSITASATGSTDTLSGFSKYQYSKDNSTWQDSGTFTGIKSGTDVTIYARAVDKVGNVSTAISNKGTTSGIGKVTITPSHTAWTKSDVTVTLSHAAVSGYTLQYSYDGSTWSTYSSALKLTSNKTVYGRMYNSTLKDEGDSANSRAVSIIDKTAPSKPTSVKLTITTNGVTASATGSTDTLSGFSKYQYSKDNSTWQDSGTFTGIKSGTNVTIYARALDKVGNISETNSSAGTTTSLGKVTITPSHTAWTKEDVTVTLSHAAVSGYTLQYSYNGSTWSTYSSALKLTSNKTVYGRMYNSTLKDEGDSANSKAISIIDKTAPGTPTSVKLTFTTNGVTAVASGSTDGESGFSKYQYSKDNKTWQDSGSFSGIKSSTAVTIYARAVDKVGNISGTKSSAGTTTGLGKVTITPSHTAWTKEDVTVTLSHAAVSGYTLQYSYDGTTWSTYSSALTLTSNKTVYGRMYNSTLKDEGNSANSKKVSIIDKTAPTKPAITASTTSVNTVTVSITTASTDTGGSGLDYYEYSKDGINWQKGNVITGIKSGTSLTVYARAVDKVGNTSAAVSNTGKTVSLGKVTITQNPQSWTNGSVTVTISHAAVSGYTLQYSYDGSTWNTYSSALTVSENKTVYGRIYNSTINDEGDSAKTINITNIDKVQPNAPTDLTFTIGTTSITAAASGGTDNYGEVSYYQYSKDGTNWQNNGTFSSLTCGTSYKIYARTVDKAGNTSASLYSEYVTTSIALKASFSGKEYTSGQYSTNCSISAKGQYKLGAYYYNRNGTLTISGIPKGAVINYTCVAPTKTVGSGTYATKYTTSAKLTFGSSNVYTGTASSKTDNYTTPAAGTLKCVVTSSYTDLEAKITINSITYNGTKLTITY